MTCITINKQIKKLFNSRNIPLNTYKCLTNQYDEIYKFAILNKWRTKTLNKVRSMYFDLLRQMINENNRVLLFIQTNMYNLHLINGHLLSFNRLVQPTLKKAQQELSKVNINIYDFVDGRYDKVFATRHQLYTYTYDNCLVYPKETAKQSPMLKLLLKHF